MAEVAGTSVPLFPLDHVLMPGCGLPLRVFEPRYRQLLADVTEPGGDRRFGVVCLLEGREVRSPRATDAPVRTAGIGTMAEILEVEPYADGTSAVLTVGSSRFEIDALTDPAVVDTGRPYLTAHVRMLDEALGEVPDGLAEAARTNALAYAELLANVTQLDAEIEPYPRDPIALSYRLASEAPLPRCDRQALLELSTAGERLRALSRILRRELTLLRKTRTIAVSPAVLNEVLRLN